MRTQAFTLVEILVSIMILMVVSLAMVATLHTATRLFQRGETARAAGDDTIAIMAALQDDLARLVPPRIRDGKPAPEHGRVMAEVKNADTGDCALTCIIENPDRQMIARDGTGDRLAVCWDVIPDPDDPLEPTKNLLRRRTWIWDDTGTFPPGAAPLSYAIVTRGCLHFGIWCDVPEQPRIGGSAQTIDWSDTLPFSPAQPLDTGAVFPGEKIYLRPSALRLTLVLSGGGRYAVRGTLAQDIQADDQSFRIAGISGLPTLAGSVLRMGDEWVQYDRYASGTVQVTKRGANRSQAVVHHRGTSVMTGMFQSLVVLLPR